MLRLNLKIAFRNLWKYKGYTAINILGLCIGLASCILIFVFVNYQMSFDKGYENSDRIYRVVSDFTYPGGNKFYTQGVPRPLAPAMKNDFSQFEKVAAVQKNGGIIKVKAQDTRPEIKAAEDVFYVEPAFFEIFKWEWLTGSPRQSLNAPNQVVLSEKMANTYFGNWKNALGKVINFDSSIDFTVKGVIKDAPQNSSFPFNIVFSYASYADRNLKEWGSVSSNSECYVLLKQNVKIIDLKSQLAQFLKKYYDPRSVGKESHSFQPLAEVHHDDNYGNFANRTSPYKQLIGLSIIGLFLLITACINFVNLATAQAISRSKEVGVRKVMGSRRKQLVWQFLSETSLITFIALLLACVVTEIALPEMANLFGGEVTFSLFGHPIIFLFLALLLVIVSFLAGLYPAFVMSGFSPALAIKNKINTSSAGGVGLRKTLVVVQFAITGVLIVSTIVVMKQMDYIRNKSLGYDTKAVALMYVPADSLNIQKFSTLKTQLLAKSGIKSVSFCSAAPTSDSNNETSFTYNSSKTADFQVNTKVADADYFNTFGLHIIAGRPLSKSDTTKEFVVNETFLKMLHVKEPSEALGKIVTLAGSKGPVVGVVKDFNSHSLHNRIAPIAIFSRLTRYYTLAIKLEREGMVNTMKSVENTFNSTFPDYVYDVRFLDDQIKNYYETERVMGVLFKVFASVVIFISFIGLFGLISFVATQRTKEIAIRKVLGATNIELVKMLNSSFLWMVSIANLLAWPIAYILINRWLSTFEYRTPLTVWPFVFAMLMSLAITLITVSLRSYRAARANTIDALKYE